MSKKEVDILKHMIQEDINLTQIACKSVCDINVGDAVACVNPNNGPNDEILVTNTRDPKNPATRRILGRAETPAKKGQRLNVKVKGLLWFRVNEDFPTGCGNPAIMDMDGLVKAGDYGDHKIILCDENNALIALG
jgi:hypothetical protein